MSLYCAGSAEFGQNSQETDTHTLSQVKIRNVQAIFAGPWQSATITFDGVLLLWGLMDQIDPELIQLPTTVSSPSPTISDIVCVSFSDSLVLAVTRTGTVTSISPIKPDFSSITSPVLSVIGRGALSLILCEQEFFTVRNAVVERHVLPDGHFPEAAAIFDGGFAVLATDGTLFTFPDGNEPLTEPDVVSVAATNETLIVLKPNGRIFEVFSDGSRSQIGGIAGHPVKVFAGGAHAGCVTFEGECWTWGCGTRGQLGHGSYTVAYTPKRAVVKGGMCVVDAAAGEEHTVVFAAKESVFVPCLPKRMLESGYMKAVRMSAALAGAFVASEFDSKF